MKKTKRQLEIELSEIESQLTKFRDMLSIEIKSCKAAKEEFKQYPAFLAALDAKEETLGYLLSSFKVRFSV